MARAYGWPWPMEREEVLERLVALHDERVEEEKRGIVRWLRPEYQVPRFGGAAPRRRRARAGAARSRRAKEVAQVAERQPWPAGAIDQIGAAKAAVSTAPATPAEVAAAFTGAPVPLVARHLETLVMVGELRLHRRRPLRGRHGAAVSTRTARLAAGLLLLAAGVRRHPGGWLVAEELYFVIS